MKTFPEADSYCKSSGGKLFQPATKEEFDWVTNKFDGWRNIWIGARAENSDEYLFEDGSKFSLNGSLKFSAETFHRGPANAACLVLYAVTPSQRSSQRSSSKFELANWPCHSTNVGLVTVCEKRVSTRQLTDGLRSAVDQMRSQLDSHQSKIIAKITAIEESVNNLRKIVDEKDAKVETLKTNVEKSLSEVKETQSQIIKFLSRPFKVL